MFSLMNSPPDTSQISNEGQNLLSTPAGYATPNQVASVRNYANNLMTGSGQTPVHIWSEGLSNMVGALLGGNLLNRAGQQDLLGEKFRASQLPKDPMDISAPGTAPRTMLNTAPPMSFNGNTPSSIY